MSDLELLADTMQEYSITSGDHHMQAAAAIRELIKLQAAQAQVNQQLLDDIVNLMIAAKGAIKLGRDLDATNYISAAIAAAQEGK